MPIKNGIATKLFILVAFHQKRTARGYQNFAKAKKQLPDLHLDFYGYVSDQDVENGMIAYSKELGVDTAIQYHGYQTDENWPKNLARQRRYSAFRLQKLLG